MLPKNSKHYIIPTASDLDLNSQLVEDVVSFYYSSLRKALSDFSSHNIQVEKLGTFAVKKQKVPGLITKYKKHLNILKTETFNQMAIKKEVEKKLKQVLELQEKLDEEKQRRKEFLKRKYGE
jgi:predicted RNase H-like nuclease (RuvC/YqgF family)